jgi:hypothetical protein
MRFFHAYAALFRQPQWGLTLLFGGLCQLIPVVGPMVYSGYLFEMMDHLHRHGEAGEASVPAFDFGKFTRYLMRGLWPFLTQLVLGLAAAPIGMVFGLGMAAISASGTRHAGPVIILVVLYVLAMLAFAVAAAVVFVPVYIRAGFLQDFVGAFSWDGLKQFVRLMWKELLLVFLFLFVTAIPITLLGFLVCCVGVYAAGAWVGFAQHHLYYQLYELYVRRGGSPIPIKPPEVVSSWES